MPLQFSGAGLLRGVRYDDRRRHRTVAPDRSEEEQARAGDDGGVGQVEVGHQPVCR